jgi:Nif-specific regulatory protein
MESKTDTKTKTREVHELSILYEISQLLTSTRPIHDTLSEILDLLSHKMSMTRGTITLRNPDSDELQIEIAHGLSDKEKKMGLYKLGEGITGRVVQSGKPMIVPKIGEEPLFLNKTKSRGDIKRNNNSFICVPILSNKTVIGALSVDRLFESDPRFDEDLRLLSIIASLLSQYVILHRSIELEKKELVNENKLLKSQLKEKYDFKNIIGRSHKMHELFQNITQVAPSQATVLIRGESGTGKELIAHAIHYNSPRSEKPFIKVNCAALPETLLESELFGHIKGAFTGAFEDKTGKFEMANGGSIFLDEIGEFSLSTQIKLLRVLQEKELEKIGGHKTVKLDIRVITATNKNLEEAIAKGTFREDLFYRLNVFPIFVPALRERKTDIVLLCDFFLEKYSKANSKNINRISTGALEMLTAYHWPGNVRELENCMERAVLLCQGTAIQESHLPPSLQMPTQEGYSHTDALEERVAQYEKELIMDALKATWGIKSKAAKLLKTTERILGYKIEQYKIDFYKFRK